MGHRSLLLVDPANREMVEEGVEVISGVERPGGKIADMIQRDCIRHRRTPVSNTFFSAGYPGIDLRLLPAIQEADVVHFHWVLGLVSPPAVSALLAAGKPIVWTLHDQRPFTGGCHFSAGCRKFERACVKCPQILEDTRWLPEANLADEVFLLRSRGIHIVSPSQWLADCAAASAVFKGGPIHVIPYGVETDLFRPMEKATARKDLGLPPDGFHILFGADYGAEKRKGFCELSAALRQCFENAEFAQRLKEGSITLSYFGRASQEIEDLGMPIHAHGHIASDEKMAKIYASASLYLLPSLEDNLPNTLLECLSSGTPVAAFRTGGIPDLVKDQTNGWLVPTGNACALAEAILDASRKPELLVSMAVESRRAIENTHSLAAQAASYAQIYESMRPPHPVANGAYEFMPAFAPAVRRLLPFLVFRSQCERLRNRIRGLPLVGRFV